MKLTFDNVITWREGGTPDFGNFCKRQNFVRVRPVGPAIQTRVAKVSNYAFKEAFLVDLRGKQSLDILHNEQRRPVFRDDPKVLLVQPVAVVIFQGIPSDPFVPGATYNGVRLARRAADQDPRSVGTTRIHDPFVNLIGRNYSQFGQSGFVPCGSGLLWVCSKQIIAGKRSSQQMVIFVRRAIRRELAEETSQ